MVDILSLVPLSVGGAISVLISTLIVFLALVIADKIIAHRIDAKRILIIAIISYFLVPIIGSLVFSSIALPSLVGAYVLPLIVWIILGELLLKEADMKTKLKVVVVGFVVYILLSMFVTPYIYSLIPF